jgi:hypothetical protein
LVFCGWGCVWRTLFAGQVSVGCFCCFAYASLKYDRWIKLDQFLQRNYHEAAVYELHYVVNVGQFSLEQNIVDVKGWEATAVGQLRSQGYAYAVLTRE